MQQERRRTPRHAFVASAEVSEENGGARLKTRVSDISFAGCYVDTLIPFPHGTRVRVKIFTETQSFEAPATVVFAHAHLGMGLVFREVKLNSLEVLQKWLPAVRPTTRGPQS